MSRGTLIFLFLQLFFNECLAQKESTSITLFGVKPDSGIDQTNAISDALTKQDKLYFPAGTYLVSRSMKLHDGQQLAGERNRTIFKWNAKAPDENASFFFGDETRDIAISNMKFYGKKETFIYALLFRGVQGLNVRGIDAHNCGLVWTKAVGDKSYERCSAFENINVNVSESTAEGCKINSFAAINLCYTSKFLIDHVTAKHFDQGLQWWGGDSNPSVNGAIANDRKCTNGIVKNCDVSDILEAGIWGSMGNNIQVSNCLVSNCGDVGIDFEGCNNSIARHNVVNHCKNGALAVFFFCDSIIFEGNKVYGNSNELLASVTNPDLLQDNRRVKFIGNNFRSTSGISEIVEKGPAAELSFLNNKLENVSVNLQVNNNKLITVSGNVFKFSKRILKRQFVLQVGQCHFGGGVTVYNNSLSSSVAQGNNVFPIHVFQDDSNSSPINHLSDNTIEGFSNGLKVTWEGTNKDHKCITYLGGKRPIKVKRVENGSQKSLIYMNLKEMH